MSLNPAQREWFRAQRWLIRFAAAQRLAAIVEVDALEACGMTSSAAVFTVAGKVNVSASTLWRWRAFLYGISRADLDVALFELAPRRAPSRRLRRRA